MLDNSDLLNTIKKMATEAVETSKPVAIVYGKVLNASPIEINVEQKMILNSAQLVLTRNVTDYETEVTIHWLTETKAMNANHTHELSGDVSVSSKATVSPNPDNENVTIQNDVTNTMAVEQRNINLSHNHSIDGRKSITIHNGLEVGDEVLLLRMQGGQKYIVIDKVG